MYQGRAHHGSHRGLDRLLHGKYQRHGYQDAPVPIHLAYLVEQGRGTTWDAVAALPYSLLRPQPTHTNALTSWYLCFVLVALVVGDFMRLFLFVAGIWRRMRPWLDDLR